MNSLRGWLLGCLIVISCVLVVAAAPILPRAPRMPDDQRTLARIDRVRLQIAQPSPHLRQAGISVSRIETEWRRKLTNAGITVVDDANDLDVPTLVVESNSTGDADVPDGIGFTVYLKVFQRVQVPRLGEEPFFVPTFVMVGGGMDNQADLAATAQSQYDLLIDAFIALSQRATAAP